MYNSVLYQHNHVYNLPIYFCGSQCIKMLVSCTKIHSSLNCFLQKYGTFANRARRAFEIFTGAGMAMNGVRTCGDYMFSGHTATVTLLNFFVTECKYFICCFGGNSAKNNV